MTESIINNIPLLIFFICGVALATVTFNVSLSKDRLRPGLGIYIFFILCFWFFTLIIELFFTDYKIKPYLITFQYICKAFGPLLWVGYCYQYNKKIKISIYSIILVCILPFLSAVLTITNKYHGFMFGSDFNPGYYILSVYSLLMILYGFIFLLRAI